MGLVYNIAEDPLYQEGVVKGIEKGMEKGMEKGIEKSVKAFILNMLRDALASRRSPTSPT